MSVIAWDGKTLAADKRACRGTFIYTSTKIFRERVIWNNNPSDEREVLMGYCGDADGGQEMMAWFKKGADPEKFPASQRHPDQWAGLFVVTKIGRLLKFERTPYPVPIDDEKFTLGSGREFAMVAMHLGKTAREAVEIACLFDSACGNGIDELTLR